MTAIIKSMSQRHGFIVDFYNKPHQKHYIPPEEAEELKTELLSRRKPMVYIRHLYWLQFKDHEKPIYINMVRDPVELFISNFYYMRRGFNKKNNTSSEWKWEMSESKRAETIEQCIETKGKNSSINHFLNFNFRARMRRSLRAIDSLLLWQSREVSSKAALEMGTRTRQEKRSK